MTVGMLPIDPIIVDDYVRAGWWGDRTLSGVVREHALQRPSDPAYIVVGTDIDRVLTWAEYDRYADEFATVLANAGMSPGARLGVLLPDGAAVHICFVAAERAGLVITGIGSRAGDAEIRHLLQRTGASALVTHQTFRGAPASALVESLGEITTHESSSGAGQRPLTHFVVPTWLEGDHHPLLCNGRPVDLGTNYDSRERLTGRAIGPNDLFILNSTSGTTGLPKCVMHTQNRWFYFHQMVAAAGELVPGDVFFGAVPAPFGFGLWTAHFTPNILGAPTVVSERFQVDQMMRALERHRVSVLTCVSTQFLMMLASPTLAEVDLSALRVMFTGGEAVPYERAAAFEDSTGATVLQVFGSNETGALSRTTMADSRDRRLRTAGRVIEEMAVRIYDDEGRVVHGDERIGIPAGRGPATCIGYYEDEKANKELVNSDGWMLMGDIVEIDSEGYLRVVGRTSDFIIRGGKNISAPAVEAEIAEHPRVTLVAVVAMPDDIYGERVCAYVVQTPGASPLELDDITSFLNSRGVTREWFPERLVLVDELPRSSGAKVAKGLLRADIRQRIDADRAHDGQ
jgi:acyl-CoA synthetase